MMDDDFTFDGLPIQAGLQHRSVVLTGNVPSFSTYGLREMSVVSAKYVGDPGNRSRAGVEYTCRDLQTGDLIPACRRLDMMNGLADGDDNVLHVAQQMLPGTAGSLDDQTPAQSSDGDRVLVGFIEGSRNRAVIVGVFRHTNAKYGAMVTDGERRLTLHKGTSLEIKKDGSYSIISVSGTGVFINADGSYLVSATNTTTIDGMQVKLGANAVDANVKGTTYRAAEDTMLTALTTMLSAQTAYVAAIQPIADPLGVASTAFTAALAALTAAIAAFQAGATTYLSMKVVTE